MQGEGHCSMNKTMSGTPSGHSVSSRAFDFGKFKFLNESFEILISDE